MFLLEIKLAAALAILAVGAVGGLIPLLAARHDASRRFLSLGNALAGGIFLGAGFIHLLPEAREALEGVVAYPLASLLAAVGVVALLLIDRVLFETRYAGAEDGKSRYAQADLSPGAAGGAVDYIPSLPALPWGSSPRWPRPYWSWSPSCSTRVQRPSH